MTVPGMNAYATAKWGQRAILRTLQQETLHDKGVHVCIVSPGSINTPIYDQAANYTGRAPRPPWPVLDPALVAEVICGLADRPRRHVSVPVGPTNPLIVAGFRLLAPVYDLLVGPLFSLAGLTRRKTEDSVGNVQQPRPSAEVSTVAGPASKTAPPSGDHDDAMGRHSEVPTDLRHALRENQFVVYYQPKLDLQRGVVTSVEALVRWQHPVHGLLSPDNFIPPGSRQVGAVDGHAAELGRHSVDASTSDVLSLLWDWRVVPVGGTLAIMSNLRPACLMSWANDPLRDQRQFTHAAPVGAGTALCGRPIAHQAQRWPVDGAVWPARFARCPRCAQIAAGHRPASAVRP